MKIKFIPDWKEAWKFVSIQVSALLILVSTAYDYLPALQTYLPANWVQIGAVVIIMARIIQQKRKVDLEKPTDPAKPEVEVLNVTVAN